MGLGAKANCCSGHADAKGGPLIQNLDYGAREKTRESCEVPAGSRGGGNGRATAASPPSLTRGAVLSSNTNCTTSGPVQPLVVMCVQVQTPWRANVQQRKQQFANVDGMPPFALSASGAMIALSSLRSPVEVFGACQQVPSSANCLPSPFLTRSKACTLCWTTKSARKRGSSMAGPAKAGRPCGPTRCGAVIEAARPRGIVASSGHVAGPVLGAQAEASTTSTHSVPGASSSPRAGGRCGETQQALAQPRSARPHGPIARVQATVHAKPHRNDATAFVPQQPNPRP
jgi:hypothetical protein